MRLIAPDILLEIKHLSLNLSITAAVVGLLLWSTGWRLHRFWIVCSITVAAGLIGLHSGRSAQVQVLICGLLLAIAAGMMALEIARLLAFLGAGLVAWWLVRAVVPALADSPVGFLVGGLAGLMLYRVGLMGLTSLVGTLVVGHAGLAIAGRVLHFDPLAWADRQRILLNGLLIGMTIVGIMVQGLLDRKSASLEEERDEEYPRRRRSRPTESAGWLGLGRRSAA